MSSSSQIAETWISSFCSILGHEYFAEVSEDFIEDDFNLTGLQSQVPMYKEALEMILDVEPEDDDDDLTDEEDISVSDDMLDNGDRGAAKPDDPYRRSSASRRHQHMRLASDLSVIEASAELLYGLIHQRYITSRPGIQQMAEKYELQHFGVCPRVHCAAAKVLPVGTSDTPGVDTVKLFCPSCLDIYTPPNSRFQSVDGAYFGTTFGCLFFMTYPEVEVGKMLRVPPVLPAAANTIAGNGGAADPANLSSGNWLASQEPTQINGIAASNLAPGLGPGKTYSPRIYGFRVSERSRAGPRMTWLRSRPTDLSELDEVAVYIRDDSEEEGSEIEEDEGGLTEPGRGKSRGGSGGRGVLEYDGYWNSGMGRDGWGS
ncbi:hypothetical protein P152DRAFT_465138 [Eremomyces bilateralis CBS 781.70]|uniref:Casein kinase II subunit beta n=1 Tax=Eremomyces bilateralis CBS 781.70 TaxID=1392243 RepID=A0A6G1G829_9PEZI|nr:uncharacterized protein P152DRAFT_465138 [Eremomyces bilateralis CBS 781.70]KAF1814218.1 hypothetical protein P152DRAFT_465138 [Eremomyces bilateralis CBS 781.70]